MVNGGEVADRRWFNSMKKRRSMATHLQGYFCWVWFKKIPQTKTSCSAFVQNGFFVFKRFTLKSLEGKLSLSSTTKWWWVYVFDFMKALFDCMFHSREVIACPSAATNQRISPVSCGHNCEKRMDFWWRVQMAATHLQVQLSDYS